MPSASRHSTSVPWSIGSPSSSTSTRVHWVQSNAGPYVELSIEPTSYYPWQVGIYEPVLTVQDGKVSIPDGPGWGVEINPGWLASAEHEGSELELHCVSTRP